MNDWFKAEQHAERAHQFYEQGQWHDALAELKRALAVNPEQADWQLGMAMTLDALGRYDEAILCYRRVLRLRGDDVETLCSLAVNLLRTGRPRRAIKALEKANQIDSDFEPGYCYRILAYARQGEHDLAEQMFYTARQLVDECPHCYDHIAHSLLDRGQTDRAIWCWQQTLRLDSEYPDIHRYLARAHWQKGQRDKAHALYLEQLRDDPGDTESLLEMGNLLLEQGNPAEAGEKYRRVLELEPTDAEAHLHLGRLAILSSHLDAAEEHLNKAYRLDGCLPGVMLGLAHVAQRRSQREKALTCLQAETQRTGHSTIQVLQMAETFVELGAPEPALELLDKLIQRANKQGMESAQWVAAYHCRAVARFQMGQLQQGMQDCRAVLKRQPEHAMALQNLVMACLETGELGKAAYWLTRAMTLQPGDQALAQLKKRLWLARKTRSARRMLGWLRRG